MFGFGYGTAALPQIAATDLSGAEIARATGLLHASLGWILLAFALRLAAAGTAWPGGRATRSAAPRCRAWSTH